MTLPSRDEVAAAAARLTGHPHERRRLDLYVARIDAGLPPISPRPAADAAIAGRGIARALELADRITPAR